MNILVLAENGFRRTSFRPIQICNLRAFIVGIMLMSMSASTVAVAQNAAISNTDKSTELNHSAQNNDAVYGDLAHLPVHAPLFMQTTADRETAPVRSTSLASLQNKFAGLQFKQLNPNVFNSVAFKIGNIKFADEWARANKHSLARSANIQPCKVEQCVSSSVANFADELFKESNKDNFVASLQLINTRINKQITYKRDSANYGRADYWASLADTLQRGSGDCEDYVIAKYTVLKLLGVPETAMQMIIVKDLEKVRYHAVLAIHYDGQVYYGDNNSTDLLSGSDLSHFMPMMSFTGETAYIHGFKPSQQLVSKKPLPFGPMIPG